MPQPSRAERRRQQRGGAAPPPRRDPMRAGLYRHRHRARRAHRRVRRLQLVAESHGATSLRDADAGSKRKRESNSARQRREPRRRSLSKTKYPDTAQGGRGQIGRRHRMRREEYATLHVHTHLAIFYNGKQMQVPQYHRLCPESRGRLPLLDSHARRQRHHSHRSARHQSAAGWPLHAWQCSSTFGANRWRAKTSLDSSGRSRPT